MADISPKSPRSAAGKFQCEFGSPAMQPASAFMAVPAMAALLIEHAKPFCLPQEKEETLPGKANLGFHAVSMASEANL